MGLDLAWPSGDAEPQPDIRFTMRHSPGQAPHRAEAGVFCVSPGEPNTACKALAVAPHGVPHVAVGGQGPVVRVYDYRMPPTEGATGNRKEHTVAEYCPSHALPQCSANHSAAWGTRRHRGRGSLWGGDDLSASGLAYRPDGRQDYPTQVLTMNPALTRTLTVPRVKLNPNPNLNPGRHWALEGVAGELPGRPSVRLSHAGCP